LNIFWKNTLGLLKADSMVYLQIYINISCICKNQTATHFKFGQQLLGI